MPIVNFLAHDSQEIILSGRVLRRVRIVRGGWVFGRLLATLLFGLGGLRTINVCISNVVLLVLVLLAALSGLLGAEVVGCNTAHAVLANVVLSTLVLLVLLALLGVVQLRQGVVLIGRIAVVN